MGDRKRAVGRPKGTPLSPVERAQRRVAALRHGRRATSALRQAVPACKRSTCPLTFPCEVRRRAVEAGFGLEVCVVTLMADDDVKLRYQDALTTGRTEGLVELTAGALAGLTRVHQRGVEELAADGLTVTRPMPTKSGDPLDVPMTHPSAFPIIELSKVLGFTADQQAITPKSRGETRRAVTEADHLEWMMKMGARAGETKA